MAGACADDPGMRAPSLDEIRELRPRVMRYAVATPMIELGDARDGPRLFLKLENLQRLGAFKIRPAAAMMSTTAPGELDGGVVTASSGNFGAALAWMAREMGVPATAVVADNAPAAKLDRIREYGARIHRVSAAEWWNVICNRRCPEVQGKYLDAVGDPRARAGNGSIGLEILEQCPDVDTILVPFGGGGLLCGIAAAVKSLKPDVRVIACESELAAPLSGAFAAGVPVEVPVRPGFITGVGAPAVLPDMWPLLQTLADGAEVVSTVQVAAAIRTLADRCHVVAEGAGAVPVAVALDGRAPGRNIVCVVSGGNIGNRDLATILAGGVPSGAG